MLNINDSEYFYMPPKYLTHDAHMLIQKDDFKKTQLYTGRN